MARVGIGLMLASIGLAACSAGSGELPTGQPATSTPALSTPSGTSVAFAASDGARLTGRLFGGGSTAVVLSNMGDNDPTAWERFAPVLAERGYLVLTYGYRYPVRSSRFSRDMAAETLLDLEGAIDFVRSRGARDVVLVGASVGGMASAGLAGSDGVRAAVVLSAPAEIPEVGYAVDPTRLGAVAVPVLYVAAEGDPVVPPAATRELYAMTGGPRQWQVYPGRGHGVELFDTTSGPALTDLLLGFLAENAPAR